MLLFFFTFDPEDFDLGGGHHNSYNLKHVVAKYFEANLVTVAIVASEISCRFRLLWTEGLLDRRLAGQTDRRMDLLRLRQCHLLGDY